MGIKSIMAQFQVNSRKRTVDCAQISFPGDLTSPKHALVCLPEGLRELTLVKQFLPTIAYLVKPGDVTLLSMPGVRVHDIYPRKGFQILTPSSEQLTWSGLPKKTYLKMLSDLKFDLVINLHLGDSMFTRSVLLNFPSAVRVGRGNHLGQPFYNLEIKTKYLRDERNIYRSLFETLGIMVNRPVEAMTPTTPK